MSRARTREGLLLLVVICLGAFISDFVDAEIMIALPTIGEEFDAPVRLMVLVPIMYLIFLCAVMPVFGHVGDRIGHRKVFIAGMMIFVSASLLSFFVTSIIELIILTAVLGLGNSMFLSLVQGMVTYHFPAERHGSLLGLTVAAFTLGMAFGPLVGGFLTEYMGWRSIFLVNAAFALVVALIAMKVIPKSAGKGTMKGFDYLGGILMFTAISSLVLLFLAGDVLGWLTLQMLGLILLVSLVWYAFYRWERRVREPVLDFTMFKDRTFTMANLSSFFMFAILGGALFALPFYLQVGRGESSSAAGLLLMLALLPLAITGVISGRLADRVRPRTICLISSAVLVPFVLVLGWQMGAGPWDALAFILLLVVTNALVGLFVSPADAIAMSRVEEGTEGSGSSINETMMNLGATVGMVLFIALFFIFISVTDLKSLTPSDVVSGFSQVFMAATLLPLLAFLCCLAIRLRRGEKNGLPAGGEAGSKTSK